MPQLQLEPEVEEPPRGIPTKDEQIAQLKAQIKATEQMTKAAVSNIRRYLARPRPCAQIPRKQPRACMQLRVFLSVTSRQSSVPL